VEYPPGWTCERVGVRLEVYLVGSLSWAEALAVADHLEACADCIVRLALRRGDTGDGFVAPPSRGPDGGGRRG
jgi:hypothetical protein